LVPEQGHSVDFELLDLTGEAGAEEAVNVEIVRLGREGSLSSVLFGRYQEHFVSLGNGRYRTPPLAPGSYEMFSRAHLDSVASLRFDVVNRDVDAGTTVLPPSVRIRGALRSAVGIEMATPYEELLVILEPYGHWSTFANSWRIRPEESGELADQLPRYDTIAPGRYRVQLLGLPSVLYTGSIRFGFQDVIRQGFFEVSAASDDQMLEIVVDGPAAVVEGVVRDAAREPVPGSRVVLVPMANERQNLDLFRVAVTDHLGRFGIRGVRPGDYGVLAWEDVPEEAWLSEEFLAPYETRMEHVQVGEGGREILDLPVISGVER